MPKPSSNAPVPTSQLSKWAPKETISSGNSLPVNSPITFADVATTSASVLAVICRYKLTALPRLSWLTNKSASGLDNAAAGIFFT